MRILLSRGSGSARGLLLRGAAGGCLPAALAEEELGDSRRREWRKREGVVVIMGATGTGKSKLSVDVAGRFPAEVINSDKIQIYRGLDITTNKIPIAERRGVPHHLLGELDPAAGELQPVGFRSLAGAVVAGIAGRGRVPVVAGGSNSYIHALMVDPYIAGENPFTGAPARSLLRYPCCMLWVSVDSEVLAEHLDRRVDEMLDSGMVEELKGYFAGEGLDAAEWHPGLGKAIGVPEFREHLRRGTAASYGGALAAIKRNTRRLAAEQVRKIERLVEMGWPLQMVDATAAVAARLAGGDLTAAAAWESGVLEPSLRAVERFLHEYASAQN
ncbi:Adenylate isopentenyltransferase [Apostasia shenzhenica]|uniref:Adenylate isopentenyltransferase n=1 Tax=Apostasia shenzhenica TaxID=1088818 RepID=A0A2I0B101_9ASPA|nr:Adenylate isopentenyltransferase [Apostasia shenzhenica]